MKKIGSFLVAHTLAKEIAQLALTKKASDVVIMNLKTLSDVADYFVVCSGDSDSQVRAIANAIDDGMFQKGEKVWRTEGFQNLQWVLLDYVNVVVHVFQKSVRMHYNLEKLWGDAKMEHVEDELIVKAKPRTSTPKKKTNEDIS